jgi:hypothetical protein
LAPREALGRVMKLPESSALLATQVAETLYEVGLGLELPEGLG